VAVSPGGGRIYLPTKSSPSDPADYRLAVLAGSGGSSRLAHIPTGGTQSVAVAVAPDGSRVYVTNSGSGNVGVIDAVSNLFVTAIPVGTTPWGAAVSPDGTQAYVALQGGNSVAAINTASNTVTGTIPVGSAPWGVAFNPAGTFAYVANSGSDNVSVIDVGLGSVVTNVTVGSTPQWLSVTPDGKHVYVTNSGAHTVSVIDTATNTVIQTVDVGAQPGGVATSPDGSEVYVITTWDAGWPTGNESAFAVIKTADFSVSQSEAISYVHQGAAVVDPTSKFAGRVTSPRGIVAGALVRALQGAVEKGTATTNAAGDYSIFNLLAGTYDIEVTASGCSPLTLTSQSVAVGRTTVLNPEFTSVECPMPEVELSPPGLSFGAQGLATSSQVQSVTLTNAGGADLVMASLVKSGGNSSDFGFSHDCPTSPSTLGAGGSCTIDVTFTPSASGPRKSSLAIASDAEGSPHRAMLTGVGTAVRVTPASWDFGSRPVGNPSPPKAVTLTNLGSAPVHIWGAAISGLHAEDFQHSHDCPAAPAMLAAGGSCTFSVTFTPAGMGTHTAPLAISHDGGGSPAVVNLTGNGTAALSGSSAGSAAPRGQPGSGRVGPGRRAAPPLSEGQRARPRGRTETR